MAKKKGKGGVNRRKQSSGGKYNQLAMLLAVIALIVLALFLLEQSRHQVQERPEEGPRPVQRQKMPPRPAVKSEEHTSYSAAKVKPAPHPKARPHVTGPGTVAIIIDDMGRSAREAESLLAINLPVTFSVIPGYAQARRVAEIAHGRGVEVMVHMPMEPQGYPEKKMEKNGLLLAESKEQVVSKVKGYLQEVPYAVGANNHMGSRFTENEEKMQPVLQILQERGMFFIDSMTSPRSVGFRLAREMGMKWGTRQVFLDNVQDVQAINAQLQQVVDVARKRGSAIAICHPHRATIQALSETMPRMRKEGITFVYASQLVS
ncbi:divergent polysaccharide deacetylase family protein [Geotalea sp. SG265]|uniref:divergent polysaccharide deacetylase family protein n=1 Tax=Geotalea sp. SG265 TaxID=2922867 RepID=UPI001FAF1E69|nr:divergent polysaccharide deacetylase family protein [Geotalea sp. SG265]